MLNTIRRKLAALVNRFLRRHGPAFKDQCTKVIMHTCSLQLERTELRELAPARGAVGPMVLSGGAITTVVYQVFDIEADQVDKAIRQEPWRAFARVTMRLVLERDPEFEVEVAGVAIPPRECHKAPGLELVKNLSQYFPLLPRPHTGPIIKPALMVVS